MFQCYVCGHESVYWQADFDYEDYGLEGEGVVSNYTCGHCGADITVYQPSKTEEDE